MKKLLMFLQMFAGEEGAAAVPAGGGAETGAAENTAPMEGNFSVGQTMADGTQVANAKVAAALNRQMRRHPEMRKVYAQRPEQRAQQVPAQVPAGMPQGQVDQEPASMEQTATDGRRPWNEIKELYKDEFGADVAARIQDRFKNQADASKALEAWRPVIDALKQKAGVESDADLQQLILNDESRFEDEAEERGMSVEALKQVKAIEAENARFKAAEESAQNKAHVMNLYNQCEELKKVYPEIDFFTEMNNEQFLRWTSPAVGMSFEQAYMALHGKELQTQAMAYGMDRTKAQLGQTIQAQRARPGEGAMSGKSQAAAAEPRMNPATMTKQERKKYKDYIKSHGAIDFDKGGGF